MYKGKIVEQGPVLDIFTNPQHPYTKGLLACRPPLDRRLRQLPTISDFMGFDASGKMIEKVASVEEALKNVEVSGDETKKRFLNLQKNPPLLAVKNLQSLFRIVISPLPEEWLNPCAQQ